MKLLAFEDTLPDALLQKRLSKEIRLASKVLAWMSTLAA